MGGDEMNNGSEIGTGQPAVARRSVPDPRLQPASYQTALPALEPVPMEWDEGPVLNLDERQRTRERIASLEIIIAILVEKNERMRQQLAQYTN
jgi:hypothetical protein